MFQTILWSGQGLLHEKVSVSFDTCKREALCILMQYEIELIWNNSILIHMYNIFFYQIIMMWKSGTGLNFLITANSL